MKGIKREGPRPVIAGEALHMLPSASPVAGRGVGLFYIVARPVFFPKPISPTPIRRRDRIRLRRS
jgi:hypothetical protein